MKVQLLTTCVHRFEGESALNMSHRTVRQAEHLLFSPPGFAKLLVFDRTSCRQTARRAADASDERVKLAFPVLTFPLQVREREFGRIPFQ